MRPATRTRWITIQAILFLLSCLTPAAGRGQDPTNGTTGNGSGVSRPLPASNGSSGFSLLRSAGLRDWEAELLFGAEWDRQSFSDHNTPTERYERLTLTERARLATHGFIFDPRLVNFRLEGVFGLLQERLAQPGQDDNKDGTLLDFDASATFLEQKPYTVTAFGNRHEDVVNREFAGSTKLRLESYGASLTLREMPLYSIFSARQECLSEDQNSFGSLSRDETRNTASYRGTRPGEASDLDVRYEFGEVTDRDSSNNIASGQHFLTHDADASFRYFFGPYLERDLTSRLRIYDREGRYNALFAQATERLRIDHTDAWATLYNYNFIYNQQSNNETFSHIGSAGVEYRVFDSLKSNLTGLGNYADYPNGHAAGYGGSLTTTYDKQIPLGGRVTLTGNGLYRIDDQTLAGRQLMAPQEQFAVPADYQILLNKRQIARDSIKVTDEVGRIYTEGLDYTVVAIGELTYIDLIPGRFHGQTVIVDYDFYTGSLEYSTLSRGGQLTVDYQWISVFINEQRSDQSLLGGEDGVFLLDSDDRSVGGTLHWSRTGLQALAHGEYHDYDSTRIAYTEPRFLQSLSVIPVHGTSVNVTWSEAFFHYSKPTDRRTTNILGRLSAAWRPVNQLSIDAFAGYLQLDDTLAPDERFYDAGLRLEWQYGRLRIVPSFTVTHRQIDGTNSDEVRAALTVSRRLYW